MRANVKVAIVEDEPSQVDVLRGFFDRYAAERGVEFLLRCYDNALRFLSEYKADADIVFMDIDLPDLDGMSAAHRLRAMDKNVPLVFATKMARFAVNGYKVGAVDFLVKPLLYEEFAATLGLVLERLAVTEDDGISIQTPNGLVFLPLNELKYIEVMKHRLFFHTSTGIVTRSGSLNEWEEKLKDRHFVRCNHCYLVNLRFVRSVTEDSTTVGDETLRVSQSKSKTYKSAVIRYLGGI